MLPPGRFKLAATKTIRIVFVSAGDPVEVGLVAASVVIEH
jgi:hypothetical protein